MRERFSLLLLLLLPSLSSRWDSSRRSRGVLAAACCAAVRSFIFQRARFRIASEPLSSPERVEKEAQESGRNPVPSDSTAGWRWVQTRGMTASDGIVLFFVCLWVALFVDSTRGNETDKEILDRLLATIKYDKRVRPTSEGPLVVNVSVLLLSLSSPDESSLKYEVEFLMHHHWEDKRLAVKEKTNSISKYQYLNAIHHLDQLWIPDTYFLKHGEFKYPPDPVHIALRVYPNGTILYSMRKHLVLSCEGNLNIFPFDDPACRFSIESISYERSDLLYEWVNDTTEGKSLLKSKRLTSFNAYMVHNLTEDCPDTMSWRGNYSCLRVELVFTRDKAFYFSTVFIPGIILVTSSFITFWLEWSAAPARVVIGVTTLLTFFTTSNGFRTSLPVVSKLGAMNVWDGVSMFFIYASLLEFVLVNYIGRKKPRGESVYRTGENAVIQVGQNRKGDGRGGATAEGEAGEEKGSAGGEESARLNSAHLTEGGTGGGEADVVTLEGGSEKRRRRSRRGTEGNGKRPPPHPIRIAKTIDVISRIIFPVAYSFFLAFFFIRYKGI